VVLLEILGILERFDLQASGFGSSRTVHRMVEAARRAFADRSRWLGDPGHFPNPVDGLLARAYLSERASSIRERRATPSRKLAPGDPAALKPTETTHLSIADARGGALALTTTLNYHFGAALVAEGTGVLLNNEMDDFAIAPDAPNLYGLVGGEANSVAGGKRPLSSMTPTIVEAPGRSRPFLILGSPGGPTIITSVLQVVVNVIDHHMPLQEAVNAPRFHHQWLPDRIEHETRAFPADVLHGLRARRHRLHERRSIGNVSAIGLAKDGAWLGAADPRRGGLAAGY
jgi:gamma-glutamyltranspeptidase/glutathione hydrolase